MNHNESESDEDCEVYFLKPVNEYNIVEKIKEANEELFSTPQPLSPSLTGPQRRVQFRQNLEEFEPHIDCGNISETLNLKTDDKSKIAIEKNLIQNNEFNINLNDNQKFLSTTMAESESDMDEICEDIEDLNLIPNESIMKLTNDQSSVEPNPSEMADIAKAGFSSPELTDDTKYDNDYEYADVDDDDDLSIIAAIYMPDNEGMNDDIDSDITDTNMNPKKRQAKRRFSFRMKKQLSKKGSPSHNSDLKFNYKTCCEYRNSEFQKLPRYTGYLSEYGLTQKQWEAREKRMQKHHKFVLEKNLKAHESEVQKMNDNERAFTRWLKNKMRFPINKTRNMFDFKPQSKIVNGKQTQ